MKKTILRLQTFRKKASAFIRGKIRKILFRINPRGIYYICGSETLPPPLDKDEEADIISRLDRNPELRQVLVEHNLRLVVYIAKKFENTGIGIEDLISIGTIGLMKAIKTFLPDKNIKLATYASRCIENEILMFIRKTSVQKGEVSIDEPLSTDGEGNELLVSDIISTDGDSVVSKVECEDERRIIRDAVKRLKGRERDIIELRFGLNDIQQRALTQKEVADKLGISQSYISRLEKKILGDLRRELAEQI